MPPAAIIERLMPEVTDMALLNERDAAPDFSVPNQDGELISLESYPGKTLVLWWYPKASTPG